MLCPECYIVYIQKDTERGKGNMETMTGGKTK